MIKATLQVGLVLVIAFISPGNSQAADDSWSKKMHELKTVLERIVPTVVSDQKFKDKKSKKQLKADVKKLSQISHRLSRKQVASIDPSLQVIARLFRAEMSRAAAELDRGHDDYARSILRTATQYCTACHTRSDRGVKFQFSFSDQWVNGLSLFEKADYYSATRRFDSSLKTYKELVFNKKALEEGPFVWERAVYRALAVSIRVLRDYDQALEIVNKVLSLKSVPTYFQKTVRAWKESTLYWKKNPLRISGSEKVSFDRVKGIIARARGLQEYPLDQRAYIDYLVATKAIHDYLGKYPSGKYKGHSYYLAGVAYESLGEFHSWNLHEWYYQACIETSPHSALSEKCYYRYETSVYSGYSGSGGVFVPEDERKRLQKLRKLSKKK